MPWLPDGEKVLQIPLYVSTEFMNVTDTQTDTRIQHGGIGRAWVSHRVAKSISGNRFATLVYSLATV